MAKMEKNWKIKSMLLTIAVHSTIDNTSIGNQLSILPLFDLFWSFELDEKCFAIIFGWLMLDIQVWFRKSKYV